MDHRGKLKESEKIDKYFDLARELKNCGTIVVGVLGMISKGLELEITGRIKTTLTTALLRLA